MEVTKEQIQEWKRQYGDEGVYEYVVTLDDDKQLKGYLHTPSLMVLDACKTKGGKSELQFQEALAVNCWLGGDKELIEVDKYRAGLYRWLGLLIDIVDGELKKL